MSTDQVFVAKATENSASIFSVSVMSASSRMFGSALYP